jgi:phosphate transport system substrate-binding protein
LSAVSRGFYNFGVPAVALAAALAGCSQREPSNKAVVTGSDAMVILVRQWGEIYARKNPDAAIQVTGGGTDSGIVALIGGKTDVCMSSRPLTREERKQVKIGRGAEAVEIPVALDGVAVWVNEKNRLKSLTLDQLRLVFSGRITDWKRLGETPGPIAAYGLPPGSGTREWFRNRVLRRADFPPQVRDLPDSGSVTDAVAADERAIGYGAVSYAPGTRALKLSPGPGKPASPPTPSAIADRGYPLTRELFFYSAGKPSPVAAGFISFALSDEGQKACRDTGYVPLRPSVPPSSRR